MNKKLEKALRLLQEALAEDEGKKPCCGHHHAAIDTRPPQEMSYEEILRHFRGVPVLEGQRRLQARANLLPPRVRTRDEATNLTELQEINTEQFAAGVRRGRAQAHARWEDEQKQK